jgi:hypothetical protein
MNLFYKHVTRVTSIDGLRPLWQPAEDVVIFWFSVIIVCYHIFVFSNKLLLLPLVKTVFEQAYVSLSRSTSFSCLLPATPSHPRKFYFCPPLPWPIDTEQKNKLLAVSRWKNASGDAFFLDENCGM